VYDLRMAGADGDAALAVLGGAMGAIRSLRFSPNGACLAAAEPADFVHVYDVDGGAFSGVQQVDLFGEVAGIAFSPDSSALFVAIADTLYSSLLHFQRSACSGAS
jgi:WD40 repeat protein